MSTEQQQPPDIETQDREFQGELEHRLSLIGSSTYDDPARRDLPTSDIAALLALVVIVVIVSYLALY